jgi:hypothetical protein
MIKIEYGCMYKPGKMTPRKPSDSSSGALSRRTVIVQAECKYPPDQADASQSRIISSGVAGVIELQNWYEEQQQSYSVRLRSRIDAWLDNTPTTPDEDEMATRGVTQRSIPVCRRRSDGSIEQTTSMVSIGICTCEHPNNEPECAYCECWTGAFDQCECDVETLPPFESPLGYHNDICATCFGNQSWRSEPVSDSRFGLIDPALD